MIVNDAYEHIQEHFLIILDDYHLVSSVKEIQVFLNRFINKSAENCHLVLSSRTLLSLPDLPLLVARSQVGGIGFEELAFRADEIQSFVLQYYHVTLSEAASQDLARHRRVDHGFNAFCPGDGSGDDEPNAGSPGHWS